MHPHPVPCPLPCPLPCPPALPPCLAPPLPLTRTQTHTLRALHRGFPEVFVSPMCACASVVCLDLSAFCLWFVCVVLCLCSGWTRKEPSYPMLRQLQPPAPSKPPCPQVCVIHCWCVRVCVCCGTHTDSRRPHPLPPRALPAPCRAGVDSLRLQVAALVPTHPHPGTPPPPRHPTPTPTPHTHCASRQGRRH